MSSASRTRRLMGALTLMPSRGVSPLWRAGAIGCAAASVVLAVAMFNIRGEFDTLAKVSNQMSREEYFAKEFGARFERVFTSPNTKVVQFDPSSSEVKAEAMLLIDPETETGNLYARQLPQSVGGFALVALDADGKPIVEDNGEVRVICRIPAAGTELGSAFNDKVKIAPGTLVGLIAADQDPANATLLLRGRNL
jgi:hypothetical protein